MDGMSESPSKPKRPHPIRLTVFALVGTGFGLLFPPAIANDFNGRQQLTVLIYAVVGALAGAVTELLVRIVQRD